MASITVHLGGKLGTLFGKEWKGLCVSSPAEAIRAININTKGKFQQYFFDHREKEYHVTLRKKSAETCLGASELTHRSGANDIYILPVIKGRNNGWVKIVAGVILVIVGAVVDYFTGGSAGNSFITLGLGLILGGITQLLTPVPQQQQQLQSYNFQGNATTVNQGGSVPVFYGRYLISPLPISVSFIASDLTNTTNGFAPGTVTSTTLPGGGTQYTPGPITSPILPGIPYTGPVYGGGTDDPEDPSIPEPPF